MRINDVSFNVNWRKFRMGWSFFVPCLRIEEGKNNVSVVVKRLGFKVVIKPTIENGVKGLRVWRIK